MNYIDKALNDVLDGIERNVVEQVREAATALEEYPSKEGTVVKAVDWDQAESVLRFWQAFDITSQKGKLDKQLGSIAAEKRSKDKSLPSQIRRADEAEAAFADLSQSLMEAPDAVPLLQESLRLHKQMQDLVREKARLRGDKEAAEKEATGAATIIQQAQKAEEARSQAESRLQEELEKTKSLQQRLTGTADLQQHCSGLKAEREHLKASLASLQAEHDRVHSELFEVRAHRDAAASVEADDADLAAVEHEQALARVRQLEHELRRSNIKLAEARDGQERSRGGGTDTPQDETLRHEIKRLKSQVLSLQQAAEDLEEHAENDTPKQSLQSAQHRIFCLEAELGARLPLKETEELQSRLKTAETLLAAQMAADESSEPLNIPSQPGNLDLQQPKESLVAVLQARNRRLAAGNSTLQQQAALASQESQGLKERLAAAEGKLDQQGSLIKQLEQDIVVSSGLSADTAENLESLASSSSAGLQAGSDSGKVQAAGGLLQVVTQQRDRFRKRTLDLEIEIGGLRKEVSGMTGRAKQLEQDNVGLFERIKFLQRYQVDSTTTRHKAPEPARQQANALSHRMSCGPFQVQVGGGARSRARNARFSCLGGGGTDEEANMPRTEVEQRYAKVYEANLNPFTEFQSSEREDRLPAHERALLAGSKLMLSNRLGRAFSIVYLVAVHIFLFCLLYQYMLSSSSRHLHSAGSSKTSTLNSL